MAENNLDEPPSSADLQRMLDAVADTAVILIDLHGGIRAWSQGAVNIFGFAAPEVIGQPLAVLYPAGEQGVGLPKQELDRAARERRFSFSGLRVRKDAQPFRVEGLLQAEYDGDGKLFGYVCTARDMSSQRHSEEKFRAVIEAAPNAMVMIDRRGIIVFANRQVEKLFGYTREELTGSLIEILLPLNLQGAHVHHRDAYFSAPRPRMMGIGRDLFGIRKDGTPVPVEIGLNPIDTEDGRFIIAVIADISERIERERLVKEQRDEILRLSIPVTEIWDRVLALPIIGALDETRTAHLTENLLKKIAANSAEFVIIDISGVQTVDSYVIDNLFKTVQGARFMGAECIISGVRAETAQAMARLGVNWGTLRSRASLRDALQWVFATRQARQQPQLAD